MSLSSPGMRYMEVLNIALIECRKGISLINFLINRIRTSYTTRTRPPTQEFETLLAEWTQLYDLVLNYTSFNRTYNTEINRIRANQVGPKLLELMDRLKEAISNTVMYNNITQIELVNNLLQ